MERYIQKPVEVAARFDERGEDVEVTTLDGYQTKVPLAKFEDLFEPKKEVSFPGKINIANQTGHQTGCYCKGFEAGTTYSLAADINEFFQAHPNLLVVETKYAYNGEDCSALVFYTKVLTDEEIRLFNESHELVNRIMERRKKNEAQRIKTRLQEAKDKRAEREEAARIDREERARLEALGRVHEVNCKKSKGKK